MTYFCNSLEISIRALAVQGAAIFNRRLLESGRFQTAPPWFFHVIPHQKSRLCFQNPRDDSAPPQETIDHR
jgi:hypothetical protein